MAKVNHTSSSRLKLDTSLEETRTTATKPEKSNPHITTEGNSQFLYSKNSEFKTVFLNLLFLYLLLEFVVSISERKILLNITINKSKRISFEKRKTQPDPEAYIDGPAPLKKAYRSPPVLLSI